MWKGLKSIRFFPSVHLNDGFVCVPVMYECAQIHVPALRWKGTENSNLSSDTPEFFATCARKSLKDLLAS